MTAKLASWGRYPYMPQQGHYPAWRPDIAELVTNLQRIHGTTLAYGAGRSYGDSPLAESGHVLATGGLDRFIDVDWATGQITAEAGVNLASITQVALPNGWFLPVTPGTQLATLGGAIANDVHGKNHHVRGTFGRHVLSLGLVREGAQVLCGPAEQQPLFSATVGGLGLTGIIERATLQLMPVKTAQVDVHTQRFGNLDEFFALAGEFDPLHEYSVAWVDCLAKGANLGRGVFMVGDHAHYGDYRQPAQRKRSVPLTPPVSLINRWSLGAFNALYWRRHPARLTQTRTGLDPFFYPLDAIHHWNRIYGRNGFQQYQCVVPTREQAAIGELLRTIGAAGQGSFLAVLKRCGAIASPGLLSFPMEGTSLALDFAQNAALQPLFERLDAIVREAGGRLYPAKDAHMSASDFKAAYPAWERLEHFRDPALSSLFWKRVTE